MRLDQWLIRHHESRKEFARRVGLSPAAVTALCNDPGVWISRAAAERIAAATGGAVTPNDLLGLAPSPKEPSVMNQSRVAAALRAIEQGGMAVVTDDDDRENEGDLVMAASRITPAQMAFFIRHGCGIVCTPLTKAIARRLNLAPMTSSNEAPLGTAFTVSVDYRPGLTTGISAEERCNTARALANPNAGAADFVRPGHMFPLVARDGGVLIRSGHTEASIDLCRMAGQPEVAVICELVNDDGTVMKGEAISRFAEEHKIPLVSIADLIAYRQRNERLVERVREFPIETPWGRAQAISYATPFDPMHHLAVVFGDIRDGGSVPARLHLESVVEDVFGGRRAINRMTERMAKAGRGVIVYLREGSVGVAAPQAEADPLKAAEAEAHGSAAQRAENWREIGLGAQILKDLGVSSIRLIASKERRYVGLEGFGIQIEGVESLEG